MNPEQMQTSSLKLVPQTRDDICAQIKQMPPNERAELSAAWLELLDGSSPSDPWIHGFRLIHRAADIFVGRCGFKGPPGADGMVEIGYGVATEHQGKGYATEAAEALVNFAFSHGQVRVVRAHTRPEPNPSARVLTKAGFQRIGEAIDPEDGLVWRWERHKETA